MTWLEAIIMGLIQGLTEFLPVSSSGHLAIFRNLFHFSPEQGIIFEVLLHVGTLVAVVAVFYKEIGRLIVEGLRLIGRFFKAVFRRLKWSQVIANDEQKFVVFLLVSTLLTVMLVLVIEPWIDGAYQTLLLPGLGLLITGGVLLLSSRGNEQKTMTDMTLTDAVLIGLAQGVAAMPGISRSGTTIVTGRLRQLNREVAVRYSFILSIPAILGAMVLKGAEALSKPLPVDLLGKYILGMSVSAITGFLCIKFLLVIIRKSRLHYFAYYCFAAGGLALLAFWIKG